MKRNEIIELNEKEYTLELNRESFLQIDRLCNIQKSMDIIRRGFYKYYDEEELTDDFNLDSLAVNEEELEKEVKLKEETLYKNIERAFLIWLNPNHHLNITQVKELLKPYWEDEEKSKFLVEKYGQYLEECVEIREAYNQEVKNLKAQVNK